ncbi:MULTISPECIES: hypothetical protein [unclassified Paenibacillus]|uniref:hypothetical protein n=1 Tax=unclassified Paenibacillus TaxID=185978 RepID=UPI000931D6A1|nr:MULTISPECIES: hypothetical protein [unclassified Paenibacillus]
MSWSESYGRIAAQLASHRPSLYPTEELDDLTSLKIAKLPIEGFTGERRSYALAVKAGLLLLNESLDEAHELAQELPTREGSYLHGIMHRMEGDYPNAAYWFRMAGGHPAQEVWSGKIREKLAETGNDEFGTASLTARIREWAEHGSFSAAGFNELVELQVTRVRNERVEQWLMELQYAELDVLLQHCYAHSGGGGLWFEPR